MKSTELGMSVHGKQRLSLVVHVDDILMGGRKQNVAPMWKTLMELVHLDERTSFLDHVYVGCTQRECKPNEDTMNQKREMFESRMSATATEQLPGCEKPHAKTIAWSCDMEGHPKKCAERYCELANKKDGASAHSSAALL